MSDISFIEYHQPGLEAGHYTVRVGQRLQTDGLDLALGDLAAGAQTLELAAFGPRVSLGPDATTARYPSPGSRGRHHTALPHVILSDSTLPWLRSPWEGAEGWPAPWLGLVLLSGTERTEATRRTSTAGAIGKADEPGQDAEQPVQLLVLPSDLVHRVLPSIEELRFLAHVRQVDDGQADDGQAGARGVIVGNRLPAADASSEVHLVSLEGLYQPDLPAGDVELVSLLNWSFESADDGEGFRELALALASNHGVLAASSAVDGARAHLRRGVVPLRHGPGVSFYRGPLAPTASDPAAETVLGHLAATIPRRSEELVLYDEHVAMTDVTYAVAFALGRNLTLARSSVAVAIDQWQRSARRADHLATQLQGLARHRVPGPDAPPSNVADWFDRLVRLEPVPERYLLADTERLLPVTGPAGRAAFFAVDSVWVLCLVLGAFSVGRLTAREMDSSGLRMPWSIRQPPLGLALRSALVGWDDLTVRAWDRQSVDGTPLVVRERKLGADVKLFLFDPSEAGSAHTVEIARQPHGLHFGVDDSTSPLRKHPRPARGGVALTPVDVPFREDGRTVKIAALATSLGAADSAQFALQMVDSSPRIRFQLEFPGRT